VVFEVYTSDGEAPGNQGRILGNPFPSQWVRGKAPEALTFTTLAMKSGARNVWLIEVIVVMATSAVCSQYNITIIGGV